MPMARYLQGVQELKAASVEELAQAMMTTDTYSKVAARRSGGTQWLGVAKGAGMIHPNMATMLALILTDAELPAESLQAALQRATEESFHCITVDGDSSTNDTCLVLANAQAGPPEADWQVALTDILQELARKIAFDGEGASHQVTLEVSGLADAAQARQVGRTVLTSPLVKTAIAGKDANWGRILAAAGRAGVDFDPALAALDWNGLTLLRAGLPQAVTSEQEKQAVQGQSLLLQLSLGKGPGFARLWSCDLTHEYISINGDYRT
jgi:glutamate N-acetyltransferase/amino-acid N-acetyltransferase